MSSSPSICFKTEPLDPLLFDKNLPHNAWRRSVGDKQSWLSSAAALCANRCVSIVENEKVFAPQRLLIGMVPLQNRRLWVQVLVPLPKSEIYEKTRKFPIFVCQKVRITDF